MSNANCGVCSVDVLTAGTRCAISVDPKVFVLYVNFNILVDFRIDKEGSKGGVAPGRLIER